HEDKPILLSIGYAACHWCHVMEHESFESEPVAELMNDQFVCIKVDREERPDLDAIYQRVIQLSGRSGGWPLTVFLTPDQKLLLRQWRHSGDRTELEPLRLTLSRMALGGIYDHLGGGFHRYSTDRYWLVPHFEKMLYDNSQLVRLYAEAALALGEAEGGSAV